MKNLNVMDLKYGDLNFNLISFAYEIIVKKKKKKKKKKNKKKKIKLN